MELLKTPTDTDILAGIRSGKSLDEAIKAIYRAHYNGLSWWIMNNSGSRQDAEDIFQEVVVSFVQLVQKDRFRGESSIKTFLFSLNRHAWLNELKRRGRAELREERYQKGQESFDDLVGNELIERETSQQVTGLLERLGATCKKILLLFYYENNSIREILTELHYENEQVVRNKKYKCLKQLEQLLEENPALKQQMKNILHG